MTAAEKLKKEWIHTQKALENVLELQEDKSKSKMFAMLVEKKRKIEDDLLEYYEPLVWSVQFKLKKPLNPTLCLYPPS